MTIAYLRKLASGRWQCQVRLTGFRPVSRTFRTKSPAIAFGRRVEGDTELQRKLGAPATQGPTFGEFVSEHRSVIDLRDPNISQRLGWWEGQFGTDIKVTSIDKNMVR